MSVPHVSLYRLELYGLQKGVRFVLPSEQFTVDKLTYQAGQAMKEDEPDVLSMLIRHELAIRAVFKSP